MEKVILFMKAFIFNLKHFYCFLWTGNHILLRVRRDPKGHLEQFPAKVEVSFITLTEDHWFIFIFALQEGAEKFRNWYNSTPLPYLLFEMFLLILASNHFFETFIASSNSITKW